MEEGRVAMRDQHVRLYILNLEHKSKIERILI
jgi:hypothetical protein